MRTSMEPDELADWETPDDLAEGQAVGAVAPGGGAGLAASGARHDDEIVELALATVDDAVDELAAAPARKLDLATKLELLGRQGYDRSLSSGRKRHVLVVGQELVGRRQLQATPDGDALAHGEIGLHEAVQLERRLGSGSALVDPGGVVRVVGAVESKEGRTQGREHRRMQLEQQNGKRKRMARWRHLGLCVWGRMRERCRGERASGC